LLNTAVPGPSTVVQKISSRSPDLRDKWVGSAKREKLEQKAAQWDTGNRTNGSIGYNRWFRAVPEGKTMKTWQQPLPPIYRKLSDAELRVRIQLAKEALGPKLAILGHHYQQDAVIDFADFTGDSFELSRRAAEQKGIEYVVFCGVHFMAESADILTPEHVRVILPDLGAGCSMADMANPFRSDIDCLLPFPRDE
jgi:hypothetical protein